MTQLKNKDNQSVMPKTTADSVQYDNNTTVAQKISQLEQGSGVSDGVVFENLFSADDIVSGKGVVYNTSGSIQSYGTYKSVFIPLDYNSYYCMSGYNLASISNNSGCANVALAKGSQSSFSNLLVSDFVDGADWLTKETAFDKNTNIYRVPTSAGYFTTLVFKTPKLSELTDQSLSIGLCINVGYNNFSTADTLSVVKALYPIEYAGSIKGKNVAFFGDSITAGTEGGFIRKVQSKARLNIATNYGSNGAATPRLASIMLGNPFRESSGLSYKDYMKYQAVVIQIGTNGGVSGNIDNDIPDIGIYDIGSYPYEYSSSGKTISSATVNEPIEFFTKCFANTYYGNVALCIEYVRYINPNCRIFLTTIPHNTGGYGNFDTVRNAVLNIAKKMGVQVIDAGAYAGLGRWNMTYWCNDAASATARTHLNAKGNEMWASYIAHELERLWYNTNIED